MFKVNNKDISTSLWSAIIKQHQATAAISKNLFLVLVMTLIAKMQCRSMEEGWEEIFR